MPRLALLALLVLALAGCGGDDDDGQEDSAGQTTAATTEQAAPATTGEEAPSSGPCASVDQPQPRASGQEEAPTEDLDASKTYTAEVRTNCGSFTLTLDPEASPKAVASFVELARNDFFDGTSFHRIVPGFVIQGGDPSGTGTGGPGYLTEDTPAPSTTYTKGVVAMAKTASDPPGTAGSQFFVVTAEDAGLPPEYAVVGTVTDGLDVVELIGTLGDAMEQPTVPVVIEDVTITEG
jgi:cyclophilin family peptidyl-prolyl cis-trans isomerase